MNNISYAMCFPLVMAKQFYSNVREFFMLRFILGLETYALFVIVIRTKNKLHPSFPSEFAKLTKNI